MFTRRARAALAAIGLLVSSFTLPASVAATGGTCVSSNYEYALMADYYDGVHEVWGVNGDLAIPAGSHYAPCSEPDYGNDGISTWISIVPGATHPMFGSSTAIIQLGVIRCTVFNQSVCTWDATGDNSNINLVWAAGGCNGYGPSWNYLGLGAPGDVGFSDDDFSIRFDPNDHDWELRITGMTLIQLNADANPRINCWADPLEGDDLRAVIATGERYDYGDSAGSSSAGNKVVVSDIDIYRNTLTWHSPGWANGRNCRVPYWEPGGDSSCWVQVDKISGWTT